MHAAAVSHRGGVAPKTTRLRGQSIIEYVLIIAVIGLVIVFAGPGVAGAIRNQFNLVCNTLDSGTSGGPEGGGASGGGSAGTDSAIVQAAVAKDAKDWTLDDQKAVAEDIAAKGEASPAYAKAKAAMDAGTEFSMKLTNSDILKYRIIGINHDDLADGSGKAGLTFLTTSPTISSYMCYKGSKSNAGGWEFSDLRAMLNGEPFWNLMPTDFQVKVKRVKKLTNNAGSGEEILGDEENKNISATATLDKLFLLSYSEIVPAAHGEGEIIPSLPGTPIGGPTHNWAYKYPWTSSEGTQYEAFQGKVTKRYSNNACLQLDSEGFRWEWWERTVNPGSSTGFLNVDANGNPSDSCDQKTSLYVCPAWCF